MKASFLPKVIVHAVTDLTPEIFASRGIELLMLDFDNTIVRYTTSVPTEEMAAWLHLMKDASIQQCVVSISKKDRVKIFCDQWDIPCITQSKKPFPKGIRQCLIQFNIAPEKCALAGDQIFTDTLGANGCGVQSILVKAIDNHNFWLKARHVLEKPFIFAARKRRI